MNSTLRKVGASVASGGPNVLAVVGTACLVGSLLLSPALAAKQQGHSQDARQGHHGQRDGGDERRHDHRRPDRYEQPVYIPPPVYYEPRQSPGISLFFPLDLRR